MANKFILYNKRKKVSIGRSGGNNRRDFVGGGLDRTYCSAASIGLNGVTSSRPIDTTAWLRVGAIASIWLAVVLFSSSAPSWHKCFTSLSSDTSSCFYPCWISRPTSHRSDARIAYSRSNCGPGSKNRLAAVAVTHIQETPPTYSCSSWLLGCTA